MRLSELRSDIANASGPDGRLDGWLLVLEDPNRAPAPDAALHALGPTAARNSRRLRMVLLDAEANDPEFLMKILAAFDVPPFTASLDAAVTLVPAGLRYNLRAAPSRCRASIISRGSAPLGAFEGEAATAALALCLARVELELAKIA